MGLRLSSDSVAISKSINLSISRTGGASTVAVSGPADGTLTQNINVGDTSSYALSSYAYNNTAGSVGGTVDATVASLYAQGSTIATTYTNVGSGWWKLTGTATGVASSVTYGLLVKSGKTIVADDMTLAKNGTYTAYTTSAHTDSQAITWDSFSASTSGTSANGTITYQLCADDGSTCQTGNNWQYYTGSAWATATDTTTTVNTAAQLTQTAMQAFPTTSHKISIKVIFSIEGSTTQPIVTSVAIGYTTDTVAPNNPVLGSKLNTQGGSTSLITGGWYNYSAPYFSWSVPSDNANPGGTPSGVAGYYVYFGIDNTADPYTAGAYQTGTTYTAGSLTSGNTYYFLIKTQDNAGNRSSSANLFTYKYDATAPTNPAFVSVSPSGYSSTNSFTFIWASSGVNMASDTGGSGLAGYQYKTGASSGVYSNWSSTITDTSVTLTTTPAYQEGANIFQLRAIDTAGNTASAPITATFYYAGNAPSAPQNVSVSPATSASSPSASNSFSFSWNAPATYNGSISQYQYSINSLPTSTNTTITTATSLSASSFATQQGKNTLYVVAKDEAGNINYNVYGSVDFYAQTPAPGTPTALQIFDISNRDTQEYADSLKWNAPTSLGTGFNGYEVYRSADNSTFSSVGTTSGTTYADTGLLSQNYYYYIKSKDNAGQYSTASSTVSIIPTGKYTSAPTLESAPKTTTKAFSSTITWDTDREASSIVKFSKDKTKLDQETSKATESVKKHSIDIKGLEPETTYYFKAVWIDEDGNQGTSDQYSFTTGLRPKISEVATSNITLNSATISWTSTTISTSTLAYGKTTSYGQTATDSSNSQTTTHSITLTNLDHSSTYNFQISGTDTDGNTLTSDNYSFNTLVKPAVSNVRFESVKDASTSSVRFSWTTNVPATSIVYYAGGAGGTLSKSDADYKTEHDLTVSNLSDQTTYSLYVKSVDQYGNSAQSDSNSFTTPDDTRPPKVSNLSIEIKSAGFGETQKAQIVASWETDEPATSQVEYGPGISGTEYANKSKEDAALSTSHVVIVSELEPSKIYHLKAVSRDNAKNQGQSDDTTVITGKVQKSVIDIIINSLEKSLGWMFRIFK